MPLDIFLAVIPLEKGWEYVAECVCTEQVHESASPFPPSIEHLREISPVFPSLGVRCHACRLHPGSGDKGIRERK